MDDQEFKNVLKSVNNLKCIFEKATLTRCYSCCKLIRRNIGEREASGCNDELACGFCAQFLRKIRAKASFTLHSTGSCKNPLPHAKEVKAQCGGLSGLEILVQANLESGGEDLLPVSINENSAILLPNVQDIYQTLTKVRNQFSSLDEVPWPEVIQSVAQFSGRKKRRSRV